MLHHNIHSHVPVYGSKSNTILGLENWKQRWRSKNI